MGDVRIFFKFLYNTLVEKIHRPDGQGEAEKLTIRERKELKKMNIGIGVISEGLAALMIATGEPFLGIIPGVFGLLSLARARSHHKKIKNELNPLFR